MVLIRTKDTLYIKRIIGLPGEKVEIRDAKIYINDNTEPLVEDYLPEPWVLKNDGIVFNVPEGCYLMLGDNRNHSSDARVWKHDAIAMGMSEEEADKRQYINKSDIIGKAVFRYWPITEMKFF